MKKVEHPNCLRLFEVRAWLGGAWHGVAAGVLPVLLARLEQWADTAHPAAMRAVLRPPLNGQGRSAAERGAAAAACCDGWVGMHAGSLASGEERLMVRDAMRMIFSRRECGWLVQQMLAVPESAAAVGASPLLQRPLAAFWALAEQGRLTEMLHTPVRCVPLSEPYQCVALALCSLHVFAAAPLRAALGAVVERLVLGPDGAAATGAVAAPPHTASTASPPASASPSAASTSPEATAKPTAAATNATRPDRSGGIAAAHGSSGAAAAAAVALGGAQQRRGARWLPSWEEDCQLLGLRLLRLMLADVQMRLRLEV